MALSYQIELLGQYSLNDSLGMKVFPPVLKRSTEVLLLMLLVRLYGRAGICRISDRIMDLLSPLHSTESFHGVRLQEKASKAYYKPSYKFLSKFACLLPFIVKLSTIILIAEQAKGLIYPRFIIETKPKSSCFDSQFLRVYQYLMKFVQQISADHFLCQPEA